MDHQRSLLRDGPRRQSFLFLQLSEKTQNIELGPKFNNSVPFHYGNDDIRDRDLLSCSREPLEITPVRTGSLNETDDTILLSDLECYFMGKIRKRRVEHTHKLLETAAVCR